MGGFLDLFSGTGAMGVEAWSRGYRPVVCVDREPQALDCLRQNVLGTEIQVLKLDLSRPLRLPEQRFSIIFADPPYAESKGHFSRMASGLASRLDPEGLLVWETDRLTELPEAFGLLRVDDRAYGNVRFHLFVPGRE